MSDVPRPGDLVRLCKSGIPTVTGFMTPDRGLAAGTREVPVGPGMVVAGPVSPRRSSAISMWVMSVSALLTEAATWASTPCGSRRGYSSCPTEMAASSSAPPFDAPR